METSYQMYFLITTVVWIPQFQIVNRKSKGEPKDTQTIQLTVSFLKRAWSFDVNISWNFYILSIWCFTCYCVHISTVYINSSYFNVYSKPIFIYLHDIFIWFWFLSYTLFYKNSVFFSQPQNMILLYDTNNDVEENGGNFCLRVLVFVGMKDFSTDI